MSYVPDTQQALQAASIVFRDHDLPAGWDLNTTYWLEIRYVYIDGEGMEEMKNISKALGKTPTVGDHRATVEKLLKTEAGYINVKATMEIVEEPVKVKESTKARVLSELMGD